MSTVKNILITGALGHIGSGFIHRLQPQDFHEVVLLDNLSTQRFCSLFNLPDGVRFHFIEGDILSADLGRLLPETDAVVHLAAITDAASSFEHKDRVEKVNLEGTQRVGQACAERGCPMVFISTTSVYGTQESVVDENCSLEELKPQSPYAESKLQGEEFLKCLGRTRGLKFIICRFGTIFGVSVGMRFHTAVNKFCWQAALGLPLTVWRTAMDHKTPYLDLGDAVEALRFILQRGLFDGRVYNVVTTNASVHEVVDAVRLCIPELSVNHVDSAIMNQLSYHVSSERFARAGFQFQGNLQQGIAETIRLLKGVAGNRACGNPGQ
jgi:nucleoside-diphosphate-sugar epimerase